MLNMIDMAVEQHFVSPANRELLTVCNSPAEVIKSLRIKDRFNGEITELRDIVANK